MITICYGIYATSVKFWPFHLQIWSNRIISMYQTQTWQMTRWWRSTDIIHARSVWQLAFAGLTPSEFGIVQFFSRVLTSLSSSTSTPKAVTLRVHQLRKNSSEGGRLMTSGTNGVRLGMLTNVLYLQGDLSGWLPAFVKKNILWQYGLLILKYNFQFDVNKS